MASRGGVGIELWLDKVPLREAGLVPYEILLSESQERMLLVAAKGREEELLRIFRKWDLNAAVVGCIIGEQRWRAWWRGQLVADLPADGLTEKAPVYDRPSSPPKKAMTGFRTPVKRARPSPQVALRSLLASPNVSSRRMIFRQYDWIVRGNTVVGPGGDAAVLRVKGTSRGLALKVDSNPRACARDPYLGTQATVCEAVRNVACVGARPAGITNCLNYGNPERPEIMWQFIKGIEGLRAAALAFNIPVVSGNVSFYNETEGRPIPPTPTIAVVGILDDVRKHIRHQFAQIDDLILAVRTAPPVLAASEYDCLFGNDSDEFWTVNLGRECQLVNGLIEAASLGLIRSAHDVAEGGTAVTLAEACFNSRQILGAEIVGLKSEVELFGEGPSTIIISTAPQCLAELRRIFEPLEVLVLGRVTKNPRLRIAPHIDEDVRELLRIYEGALPLSLNSRAGSKPQSEPQLSEELSRQ